MDENVINFSSARDSMQEKEREAAYEWFVTTHTKKNAPLENVKAIIENDKLLRKEGYKQLMFYNGRTAIWVRLWDHPDPDVVVSYTADVAVNYNDLLASAPNSLAEMLENGIDAYRQKRLYV